MRCCAVRVLSSPLIRTRSRIVNAIESRISARLPPTVCWIEMAVAISSRSSDFTRRTMFSSATSNDRPRLTSRMTRPNSVEIGGRDSRTTSSMAWRNEEPARRALAISVMVSGSCLLNELSRLDFRRFSQKRGSMNPIRAPMRSTIGLRSAGNTTDSTTIRTGTPIVHATQMTRYSLTFRRRSARAISRARFAPKSRCSTTLFSWDIAWLDWSASASPCVPPAPPADVGFSWRPEAYRSRRAFTPEPPPDIAMPTAITRIARAAMPAMRSVMGSMSAVSCPGRLVVEPEQARRQVDALDLELLDELGPDAGRLEATLDLALDDARLFEHEHVLHHDDVTFHALDLGDVRDPARAVLEAGLVDDEVHGRGDLLADGADRQVDARHQHHRLETGQHV